MRQAGKLLLWSAVTLAVLPAYGQTGAPSVTAVYGAGVPAYLEALRAFRESMEAGGVRVTVVGMRPQAPAADQKPMLRPPVDLVVTFGSAARAAVANLPDEAPMIASMILADQEFHKLAASRPGRLVSAVSLDVPPSEALARLKEAFPGRRRVAVVYNPATMQLDTTEFLAAAHENGMALELVPCTDSRCLLEAAASRRGQADYLWCLPDASLYPAATVTPLVLASVRSRLPIIGFSEGFVGAGAVAGFYADQSDIGLQTAELAKAFLEGLPTPALEAPRTVRFAVNLRMLRLLGIDWREPPGAKVLLR